MSNQTRSGMKLGTETGSIMNFIKSADTTAPVVGEGATELQWTDRKAYTVVSVSIDGRRVSIQSDRASRTDSNGMSDAQAYAYETDENGIIVNLTKWNNSWRRIGEEIVFTGEFSNRLDGLSADEKSLALESVFKDGQMVLVEGKTCIKKSYEKFNVVFGKRDAYHDYSF